MLLRLCKFSVVMLFFNLYIYYTLTGNYIPNGTMIFGLSSVLFMLLDAVTSTDYKLFLDIRTEMITLILFLVWCFITVPLALNSSASLRTATDVLQKMLFVFVVYYICRKDGSLRFITMLFLVISIAAALISLSMYGAVSDRLSLSENISINSTGNLMVLGTFCALYLYQGKRWYSFTLLAGSIALFAFIIALTGSRKSIFAVLILIVLFVILAPKKPIVFTAQSFFSMIVLLVLIYVLYSRVAPMISDTSLYARLFDEEVSAHANASNEGRWLFYQYAWNDFLTNPFSGLGIGGYQAKHGSYSHSAYMEVLAGTGIVGIVLYFTTYVRTFAKLWKEMRDKTLEFFALRQSRLVFCFYIVFLYIGLGIGHLYDNLSMLELGMFMAAGCGLLENKKQDVEPEGVAAADAG